MKHFKHLKSGMSIIEVIASIAILAIFGSSLFLMQEYLFGRMTISQNKLIANLRMQDELIVYQTNILKELFAEQGPVNESLQEFTKYFARPDMKIKINTKSNFNSSQDQKENPLKDFKNLYLIAIQAQQDESEYGRLYVFTYIPEVLKA
ncbi:MAG: prepilin-type N-terminal cleavage/methylation domain-containing protein [Candidatus Dependentiae bacterium]|nr:prepilin-type N-terminal cleavage/methylation domain-containing protein [Candidatus Dependentiae bacterium]